MGITRDTVWCVICDRESIVTRTHKQICYIHWSRTIDLRVPHLAQHVPPVVVNIICYQWWDESVVAGLRLSRHNLIKLLPATPRGISLYIIQATEVNLKLEYFCISLFLSISRSQDECFEIFSGLCITGFSSQLVLSANIIHHHKLNLQIEFSALCSQEWLQCCRCEAWDNDELSSVTRPGCHPPEE